MTGIIISIIVFAVSVFVLSVTARYGLMGARKLDSYFSEKNNSNYQGFQWDYRIPFSIGLIPEYFYAIVLGYDNYFRKNWWALKTASFISILIFIALLKSRSAVYDYFSFDFIRENGIAGLFTSGNLVLLLNIIVLLFTALFVLICIESIKMHGIYAPIRILAYSILSFILANLTIITLSIIILITVIYIAIKIIGFLFFSSKDDKDEVSNEESAGFILKRGFRDFKAELHHWKEENKNDPDLKHKASNSNKPKRKRPKITRRKKTVKRDDDVPRLHPD